VSVIPDWHARGLCRRELSPDAWFPDASDTPEALEAARICRRCPVQAECLGQALARPEQHGIWGATNPTERRRLRREVAA
jgi:WhiB family transcriptional regulator, redox-sensing transcriptional regulator